MHQKEAFNILRMYLKNEQFYFNIITIEIILNQYREKFKIEAKDNNNLEENQSKFAK